MNPTNSLLALKSRLDMKELPDAGGGWCLTAYIPFHKNWREPMEDDILIKDLSRTAQTALEERGAAPDEIEALLAPLKLVSEEKDPSVFRGEGMAILASRQSSVMVLLSKAPPALVEVDRHFRLDYLLPALLRTDRFYLLGLSLKSVHLWDCDGITMEEIPLEGLETNIRETPHFQDSDPEMSFHANSGSPGRNRNKGQGSAFFGQGSGQNDGKDMKKEMEHFFRSIDAAIVPKMPDHSLPLILAGVEYLLPIYREVNSYSNLSPLQLRGNPEALGTAADLHANANAVLRAKDRDDRRECLEIYRENITTGRTAAGFTDIVPSACFRKMTHLFVREGGRRWGSYDKAFGKTEVYEDYRAGAENLVNLASTKTLEGHGMVFLVPQDEMPADAEIAGLCRN